MDAIPGASPMQRRALSWEEQEDCETVLCLKDRHRSASRVSHLKTWNLSQLIAHPQVAGPTPICGSTLFRSIPASP
jgi:hypothetical protein